MLFKPSKEFILKDIEDLYKKALETDRLQVALKAKELQSKIIGLFHTQEFPKVTQISDMSDDQLRALVARLEENDSQLKSSESSQSSK
jgi:hypothetical protein